MSGVVTESADEELGGDKADCSSSPTDVQILSDISKRVQVKENAIHFALDILKRQRLMLGKLASTDISDIADWPERSDAVKLERSALKREWLVGLTGDTGAGKSTATNAMLGYDISPTNSSDACTAAPCIYSYNHSDDPEKVFHAIITFKSTESIAHDLELLQEELSDIAHSTREQGGLVQAETVSRLNQAQKQVKSVQNWSGLTENEIKCDAPSKIILEAKKKTVPFLDTKNRTKKHKLQINDSNLKRFRKTLKPYIDSSGRSRGIVQHWPLVQQVEIQLKSDVLRHGIKLVDLPGVADSLESRAAVAKDFFERLDKLIVVVHAVRAADNKAGSDAMLMPATLSMDMGLDGRFEPDSLAVIVTKVDDINPKNAENDFPDDEIIMAAVSTLEAENEELANLEELISRQREIIDDHDEEESETEVRSPLKKRPHPTTTTLAAEESRLAGMRHKRDVKKRGVESLTSQLKRSCIHARNLKVKQAVGQNLSDIKAQVNPTAVPVVGEFESSVLPISASAFLDIEAGDSVIGFSDANDTGIPALRDWLTRAYLPKRDMSADDDILDARALLDALDSWSLNESAARLRISTEEGKEIKRLLDQKLNHLIQTLKTPLACFARSLSNLKPLRNTTIACAARSEKGDEAPTQRACESALHAQEQWENKRPSVYVSHPERNEKVSYMTYKACVRRGGREWTTSAKPRMTYNWMSSVFWQEAFFQRLPKIINDAESRNTRIFNQYITDLVTDEEIPAVFRDLLRRRVPSLHTQRDVFLQEARSTGNDFRNDALRLKPRVSDIFTNYMAPVFAKAFSITGVGAFAEQRKVVKEQFKRKLPEMLQDARNFIEEELVSSKTERVNKLRGSIFTPNSKPGTRLNELDKIFKNLLRDARAPASKIAGRSQGTQSEAVTAAKETIRAALDEWHEYWQPIEQALPKRPTSTISDDSENEEEEEELKTPDKKKIAGGKAKPKAKPKANRAPPKPKATPRPRGSSKTNVKALPQSKIVKAKAQPRSMSVVKTEEDDEMHTGGTMAADDAPHTGGPPASRQQIGAMMAAVTAETESLPGDRQGNSAK
ncbi:hypothetical protein D7B24_006960 [Verticillium nonalfalfae]|uniref:Dynamin N-terminal domain-containing protein n=1 Tax=Verticillium nonalfalfae TaxID=1051616 RepID=A0A3M9Y8R5_9PEZI|nr:uncharacterized protein D7B24_006960 [Verticillium nonalfalfae]RNJ56714.1 hypothetical protein D7B24_006960 [Verticillium nonalfalfae]